MEKKQILPQVESVILGHAIGDALGVPVEFLSRRSLQQDPVTDYRGNGSHHQPAGTWSDDTSMTLATLDSLSRGLDYGDIMDRFVNWADHNAYTATGVVFDMGITVHRALRSYQAGTDPLKSGCRGEKDNGNGSLMRILPGALYCHYRMGSLDQPEAMTLIHNLSSLTHAHIRSQVGCGIYSILISEILRQRTRESVQSGLQKAFDFYETQDEITRNARNFYRRIWRPDFASQPLSLIYSTGYVVDTLEAAVYCLLTTDNYRDCVLKAVNLGEDTDTVAAVAGGLAGALYGLEGIPELWQEGLLKHAELRKLCQSFAEHMAE